MTEPALCPHHADVIPRMAALSHVDPEQTTEAAREMHRQCCRKRNQEETR